MITRLRLIPIVVLVLVTSGADKVQAAPVCNDTPGSNDRIECTESSASTSNITLNLDQDTISTTEVDKSAVSVVHEGTGDIDLTVSGSTYLTTGGIKAPGIHTSGNGNIGIEISNTGITTEASAINAEAKGAQDTTIDIGFHNNSSVTITPDDGSGLVGQSPGIFAEHSNQGNVLIDVSNAYFDITNVNAHAINAVVDDSGDDETVTGHIDIDVTSSTITINNPGLGGQNSSGIYALGKSVTDTDIDIDVTDTTITTDIPKGVGVIGEIQGTGDIDISFMGGSIITKDKNLGMTPADDHSAGIVAVHWASGNTVINVAQGAMITTNGLSSDAIDAWNFSAGNGDITINVDESSINTESTDVDSNNSTSSRGIYAYQANSGSTDINFTNRSSITTKGTQSHGIYVYQAGAGPIDISLRGGSTILTEGPGSYGIRALHGAVDTNRTIDISLDGGSVIAEGKNSHGIQVGGVSQGDVNLAAEFDSDGYRKQTVTVNGQVTGGTGTAAGVYLAGGGKVFIGPRGSIGADSGIAILATGDTPGEDPVNDPPIKPKLLVDMNLAGRRVAQVIGDDYIINDGGKTTIVVNDVELHNGANGVALDNNGSPAKVVNGAWNVTMREHGFKLDDYTNPDPSMWTRTQSADTAKIIADRDFAAADFTETARPRPPPPMCPAGQIGTPPDCEDPPVDPEIEDPVDPETMQPTGPMFTEEYAPRSALYESLPDFLLRMADRGRLNHRPVSPVWMVFSGGDGSVDSSRSTTGADYDYDRYRVQLGKNLSFGEGLDGWLAVHYTQGDSEVSSPTGGGDIDAEGAGAAFNIQWQHASGYYVSGRTSFTAYDVDLSSDDIGRLRSSVDALGTSLGLETGMRLAMGETLHLTPRAWLSHSSIDIDSFTDAVDAKASFPDEVRLTGGIGALAQTMQPWKGGELTWHGSLDLEQMLNSRSTSANVSGEQLKTETVSTRMLLGLGSLYRKGDFSISGQVAASGLGTNDEDYSGQVNIGVRL